MRHHLARLIRRLALHGSVAAALAGLATSPACLWAAEPAANAVKADETFDDLKLNVQARKLLQQDKRLAGLNVGVTVRDRVATLWGPVPSGAVGREAAERLRQMRGILTVNDETKVVAPADTLPAQVAAAVRQQGKEPEPQPGVSTVTTAKVEPEPRASDVVVAQPTSMRQSTSLKPAAVLLKPVFADGAADDFDSLWEKLRAKEARFRDVTLDSQAGVVRINGTVARLTDAWELAEKLAELPGVKLVLLDKVEVK